MTITQGQYIVLDETPPPLYLLIVYGAPPRRCQAHIRLIHEDHRWNPRVLAGRRRSGAERVVHLRLRGETHRRHGGRAVPAPGADHSHGRPQQLRVARVRGEVHRGPRRDPRPPRHAGEAVDAALRNCARGQQHAPFARSGGGLEGRGSHLRYLYVIRPVVSPRPRQTPRSHRRPLRRLETEERYIDSVSDDGRTVTLTQRLYFQHLGDGYWDETGEIVPEYRAEVGLLTRNVVVQGAVSAPTRLRSLDRNLRTYDLRAHAGKETSNQSRSSSAGKSYSLRRRSGTTPSSAGSATSRSATRAKASSSANTQFISIWSASSTSPTS